eukprot:7042167-Karenia_brevis.AAC.1
MRWSNCVLRPNAVTAAEGQVPWHTRTPTDQSAGAPSSPGIHMYSTTINFDHMYCRIMTQRRINSIRIVAALNMEVLMSHAPDRVPILCLQLRYRDGE